MAQDIRLISTDFDGTLVEHGVPAPYSPLLLEVLGALRERGIQWAINTGRTLPALMEALESFALPLLPDFALTSEREIFFPSGDGRTWLDRNNWNERCAEEHRSLFDRASEPLRHATLHLERKLGAKPLYDYDTRDRHGRAELAGFMARDEEHMRLIADYLDDFAVDIPKLSYQRNSIYLRFCHADYDKGVILAELGRQLDIGPESIFAVGDHFNDLAMLDGKHAHHVACPANSIPEVKELVERAGGYIAGSAYSAGVIEALNYYCN